MDNVLVCTKHTLLMPESRVSGVLTRVDLWLGHGPELVPHFHPSTMLQRAEIVVRIEQNSSGLNKNLQVK